MIFMGRVKNIKIGQITALANPITTAAMTAEKNPLTSNPFIKKAVNSSESPETTQCKTPVQNEEVGMGDPLSD